MTTRPYEMTEGIWLIIVIYALVIVISLLVAVLIKVIMGALSLFGKLEAADVPAVAIPEVPPEPAVSDIPAIAAAVYTIMGIHRIVHIQEAGRGRSWTDAGRIIHQTSHAIPHKPRH